LRVRDGHVSVFATLPSSVAAFHLAFGPDGWLYVTAPTLSPRDPVYRISPEGALETFCDGLGRPQGLAFDSDGHLYVVDAVAGSSAVYRFRSDRPGLKECVLSGGALLGLAFDPLGGLVVSSSETVYRLDVGLKGVLPIQAASSPVLA
jgi:sugar lactone lactonase YvrE